MTSPQPLKRRDSLVESYSSSCDLSSPRDVNELIDAVSKLLRLTDLSTEKRQTLLAELKCALGKIVAGTLDARDKSLVTSAILREADNLKLPDDEALILPIVRKLIALLEL